MSKVNEYELLFGRPIKFDNGVYIKSPTIDEAVREPDLAIYTLIFTITTRELFQTLREVDELEKRYPSVWAIMQDEEADMHLGSFFADEKPVSATLMEALSYWTGLTLDGPGGFHKHKNGKIVHIESEWIIDYETFTEFAEIIKVITAYEPPESLPPPITSDSRYKAWMSLLNGRRRKAERNGLSWAHKILILSISTESYIPIENIAKMSLYHFYQLFNALSKKEVYQTKLAYQLSPKFESDSKNLMHWKETINR